MLQEGKLSIRRLVYLLTSRISFIKTVYFNLNYFPLKIAVRMPVIIYRGTRLISLKGKVELDFYPVKPGAVQIGRKRYGFHSRQHVTIWEQRGGTVIFGTNNMIGKGTFFMIGENATLKFGHDISFGGNDKLICKKSVEIGNCTVAAWDVQITDTDFHPTVNTVFNTVNCAEKPIRIGNYNWLGFGSTILKGSVTPDYCIVAANTTIRHDHSSDGKNIVLGQEPDARVTAKYVRFDMHSSDVQHGKQEPDPGIVMQDKRSRKSRNTG